MAMTTRPLRGRSEFIREDGTVIPVRDFDGKLVIDAALWREVQGEIAAGIGRQVSQLVAQRPELREALGITQDAQRVRLMDLLQPEKAPAGAGTTDRRKEK